MTISDKDRARAGDRKQCGRRHSVGDKRLSEPEIAELTGKSKGYTWTCLQRESAEHFIKRVGLKKG